MTQNEDDDAPVSDLPSFAAAKKEQQDLIAELQDGDAGERRVAKALTQCHKGNRCNLVQCPICERRKDHPKRHAPAGLVKSLNGFKYPSDIYLNGIELGKRRPLNEKKVSALAASMDLIGQMVPITVRVQKKRVFLVSGLHRIAAAKRLGWDGILAVHLCGDKTEARLWQLMENFYRTDLTVLERAEHVEELRTLVQTMVKGGATCPPGGLQPKDAGIKKTAKLLGLTREEIRRAMVIAGISPRAKKSAKSAKLDNSQRALLEIARQPTAQSQVRVVKEIVERKRADRARHASAAEQQATQQRAKIKAGLAKDKRTVENLQAKIAENRQLLRALKDAPAADSDDIAIVVTPMTEPSQDQSVIDPPVDVERLIEQHAAEVGGFQNRIRELEEELSTARQTMPSSLVDPAGPATDADDLAVPPFLLRRAFSEDEQRQFDDLERVWATTWPLVRQRFLAKYAGGSASTTQSPTSSNIH